MKHNNEEWRWLILSQSFDRWAKQGVATSAPDAKVIEAQKNAYRTMSLHERINARGGTNWKQWFGTI